MSQDADDPRTVNHAEGSFEKDPPDGVVEGDDGVRRCWWCADHEIYRRYHDTEWGFPVDEDQRLFEKLCLEAFQAGLSWLTILRFREAFEGFDPQLIAEYGEEEIERLLAHAGIVRNRQKIEAVIHNAQHLPAIIEEFGSFADYVWQFAPAPKDRPDAITRHTLETHTTSAESKALAKDLNERGVRFVGPTIAYSFMQAMGLVDDHIEGCDIREEVATAREDRRT